MPQVQSLALHETRAIGAQVSSQFLEGRTGVQSRPQLHWEFEARLSFSKEGVPLGLS